MITYYATEINLTRVDKIVIEYASAESIYISNVINNYKFFYIFAIFIRSKQKLKKLLYFYDIIRKKNKKMKNKHSFLHKFKKKERFS